MHRASWVAEHSTHAPEGWHAGVDGVQSSSVRHPVACAWQSLTGVELLRGVGVPVTKSSPFSSVSWHPPTLRMAAVGTLVLDAGADPSNWDALLPVAFPKPTKSITSVISHAGVELPPHAAVNKAPVLTMAIFPDAAPMTVEPAWSAVGKGTPAAPLAMAIRKYFPGSSTKLGNAVLSTLVGDPLKFPVALAY